MVHHNVVPLSSFDQERRRSGSSVAARRRDGARVAVVGWSVLVASLTAVGLLLTYAPMVAFLRRWDSASSRRLAVRRTGWMNDATGVISQLADAPPVVIFAAMITAVIVAATAWRLIALLPFALVIELTAFLAVNHLVRRPRPDVEPLGSVPSTFSFPSGHVAVTLVIWLSIGLILLWSRRRRAAIVAAWIGSVHAVLVAFARVYQGLHHPLDTVGGALLGVGTVAIAALVIGGRAHLPRRGR